MLDVTRQNGPLAAEFQAAIAKVASTGAFVHGPACKEFEAAIAEYCGVDHAVGCASGSDALLLVLMALGVGPGDEVILPSFTFFATASAVTRLGAVPVFADILADTFNIDPADVTRKVTKRTKAVMPVHLFGQCADMDALAVAAPGVPMIEDACQAIGAEYRGDKAGAMGRAGCFSFYPTKNLGGWGDGGLITTSDADLAAQLRVLRDHGQNPRYHHAVIGINSRLDAIQAAVLHVKLPHLDAWSAARDANARRYAAQIRAAGARSAVRIAASGRRLRERVEPVYDPRPRRPARRTAAISQRAEDWLCRVLSDSASLAEVLRRVRRQAGQPARLRAGGA